MLAHTGVNGTNPERAAQTGPSQRDRLKSVLLADDRRGSLQLGNLEHRSRMPTAKEFFKSDFSSDLVFENTLTANGDGISFPIITKVTIDLEHNSASVSAYIDSQERVFDIAVSVLNNLSSILDTPKTAKFSYSMPGDDALQPSAYRFTGRVCFYCAATVDKPTRDEFVDKARKHGLSILFRDAAYAIARTAADTPLAFISHDSRDKDLIARPLAHALQHLNCPVWYDEFSLKIGDSLRESIERGIAACKKCVVIITPHFLSNSGWTKSEFNAVFSKELHEGKHAILPVWSGVSRADVYAYSPIIVDRYAGKWEDGADALASKLVTSIRA
ncbi:MAG: toll/interleukin-1 receptor domain-containing protein [Phycisphaerales bacterium]|nr:toll/interleukin-1 receptor domain-containing protein [Planctomycetota bacterium]